MYVTSRWHVLCVWSLLLLSLTCCIDIPPLLCRRGFLKKLSDRVADNVQFFITYVIVAGSVQLFLRLSQCHNVAVYWMIYKTTLEEATSQRRLEKIRTSVKSFHLDEFIPLFLFVFMIGALYGSLAPLTLLFVAMFFKCAYKVFKYMTLYVYGNAYEGGGFLFYTMNAVLFYVLYLLILIIVSYLSLHGNAAMAAVFSLTLIAVWMVHHEVYQTFVRPSLSLSLTKARLSDKNSYVSRYKKDDADGMENSDGSSSLRRKLLPRDTDASFSSDDESVEQGMTDSEKQRRAVERMEKRYENDETLSDLSVTDASGPADDFFIYRQPSLNRATWEVAPRPYRDNTVSGLDTAAEVWR